jgi:uncharacterized protein (DUF983 family)
MRRGALGRCPNCGKGKLFRSYLKQVDACAECGEGFGHIRADDAPAWLTILVTGHIVVFTALGVEQNVDLPVWVSMTLWAALTLIVALGLLPRAKGTFIAMIWALKSPGSERD